MKEKKLVTNLLTNIGKMRDIIQEGDFRKLQINKYFVEKTKNDLIRNVVKFIDDENHQCDFTSEDVRAISDEIHELIDKQLKMRYSTIYKTLTKNKPFTHEDYMRVCERLAVTNYLDTFYKPIANELANFSIAMWIWENTDYRKSFEQQLIEHIRSFI